MTYFLLMFILQFLIGLLIIIALSVEAYEYGRLSDGEKKWMKAGLIGLVTSPLGGIIIPLLIPLGLVLLVIYAFKQLKD